MRTDAPAYVTRAKFAARKQAGNYVAHSDMTNLLLNADIIRRNPDETAVAVAALEDAAYTVHWHVVQAASLRRQLAMRRKRKVKA